MIPLHFLPRGGWLAVFLAAFFAPWAEAQEKPEPRNISFYRSFLEQAEYALKEKDGYEAARHLLDLCPKELRHFEWHYLSGKTNRAPRTFKGHERFVNEVAFSPDGKTLASAGNDATIKLWDLASGKVRFTLEGHEKSIHCVAFHPRGKMLASGGDDKTIFLWDTVTGKKLNTFQHDYLVDLAFSPDGAWLASRDWRGNIHIRDMVNSATKALWKDAENAATCLAFSPDGKYFAFGLTDQSIRLWTVPGFKPLKKLAAQAKVNGLAFRPDGKHLISAGLDGLRFWDVAEGKLTHSLTDPQEAPSHALAVNGLGTVIATFGIARKTRVWFEPFEKPALYFPSESRIGAISPSGQTLALAELSTIRVYDLTQDIELIKAPEPVWSVQPGKDQLLVSMRQGGAALGSEENPQRILNGHRGQVRAVVMQPQGYLLASAGVDRVVKIWEPTGTREIHNLIGHKGLIRGLAFSPGGKHLASASEDKTVKIWDAVAGAEVRTLTGHKGMVTSVVFLPKTNLLASAGGDGTIKIWSLATGKTLKNWAAHEDIASHLVLSPDGSRLASAGTDRLIKLWDVNTGKPLHTMAAQTSLVQGLAFSPDGKRLASGSMNAVTLWDPDLGQRVYSFRRPAGPVNALAFSPDGTKLFSGSYDGSVMQWRARPLD